MPARDSASSAGRLKPNPCIIAQVNITRASLSRVPARVLTKKVAIAWDGSARAARAIRDGLDLLGKADHVAIATVVGMKGSEGLQSADELMKYLALYGIRSDIAVLTNSPGDDEGLPLRQFAASQQVDLLVMGAFVHSRLRQAILGGITHSLLADCPVPIVMSH
ncbi:universal stress protein [Mesorhizobium sp. PUT5]|uniref:universal stress protein n=1 Tax=Mesorhizobium sp. PUT5 TaxID=3454629 RepID=UPI003FA4B98F